MKLKDSSEYIFIRYMDSGFFVSGDGSFREPWQEIAYRRIKAYNYDVNAHWGEKMGRKIQSVYSDKGEQLLR